MKEKKSSNALSVFIQMLIILYTLLMANFMNLSLGQKFMFGLPHAFILSFLYASVKAQGEEIEKLKQQLDKQE